MQKNTQLNLPPQTLFKSHAKLIRAILGSKIKHSQALNLLSMQYGYNNWHICKAKIPQHTQQHPAFPSIEEIVRVDDMEDTILEYTINVLRGFEPADRSMSEEQIYKDSAFCLKFVEEYPKLWNRYLKRFYKEHNITASKKREFVTLVGDTSNTIYDIDSNAVEKLGKIMVATMKAFADKPEELAKHDIYQLDEKGYRAQDFSSDFWRKGKFDPSSFLGADEDELKRILANTSKIKLNKNLNASEIEEIEELMIMAKYKK